MFSDEYAQLNHEPARLQLMLCLAGVHKADFTFLINATGLSKGNLSVQMSKLKDIGLITIEKMIKNNKSYTVYRITAAGRDVLARYKQEILSILDGKTTATRESGASP